MNEPATLASELLAQGRDLWSSVECDVRHDRLVVYARLCTKVGPDLRQALANSELLLNAVLEQRLGGQSWLAAVQWSERLCRTIGPTDQEQNAAISPHLGQ